MQFMTQTLRALAVVGVITLLRFDASGGEPGTPGTRPVPTIGAYYFEGWAGRSRLADDPKEPWAAQAPTHLTGG